MSAPEKENTWMRTSIQNLVRHQSGISCARLFANGRQTWKSRKTDLLEVAKAERREQTEKADKMVRVSVARDRGRMTMGDRAVLLEKCLDQGYGLKGRGPRIRRLTPRTTTRLNTR